MLFDLRGRCLSDLGTIQATNSGHLRNLRITVNLLRSHFVLDCADLALVVEIVHCFRPEPIIAT